MRPRTCGFRFFWSDAVFLVGLAVTGFFLKDLLGPSLGIFVVVPVHFFLFCNVFRLRRSFELVWTGVFLALVTAWLLTGTINWWWVTAILTPLTVGLIIAEMRSPRYHGVLSRRINAEHIEEWLGRR